jgi:hypothetical protein
MIMVNRKVQTAAALITTNSACVALLFEHSIVLSGREAIHASSNSLTNSLRVLASVPALRSTELLFVCTSILLPNSLLF